MVFPTYPTIGNIASEDFDDSLRRVSISEIRQLAYLALASQDFGGNCQDLSRILTDNMVCARCHGDGPLGIFSQR